MSKEKMFDFNNVVGDVAAKQTNPANAFEQIAKNTTKTNFTDAQRAMLLLLWV